ncbi:hypothetical protein ACJJTC_018253 [Scirpophaga incertulas]
MMSLIEYAKINRHRSKRENPKKRDSTFIYFAMKGNEKIRVCRQAFSILYAIKEILGQLKDSLGEETEFTFQMNTYNNLISAAKIRGFSVKPVSSNEILDFKNSWQQCFKTTCKSLDKATTFKISQYRSFEYSSSHKGYLTCSEFIDGFVKATFLLQKPFTIPKIPETLAYVTKIPINEKKMNDIKKIIQYIPDEFKDFYNLILTWPTTRSESVEE